MPVKVAFFDAPDRALGVAQAFLAAEPVLNNVVLTLLAARIATRQAGRYWVALDEGEAVGMGLQSPLDYPINLTAMVPDVASVLADAIAAEHCDLPGATGEARIVARFAGQWAEHCRTGARPVDGHRVYEARSITERAAAPGRMQRAGAADRAQIGEWMNAMKAETGVLVEDVTAFVERRVAAGEIWLWNDGGARCMAAGTAPVAGVSRVQYVYTPPEYRRKGYAEALVRALTQQMLAEGLRPMLLTDLSNPTSNGIYLRIGYRAVAELVRYRFGRNDRP